jgi:hypothetical protein
MDINFVKGKAVIKRNRKRIATIYDRVAYYPANNIKSLYTHRYSLVLANVGERGCDTLEEVTEFINKYK